MSRGALRLVKSAPRPLMERPVPRTYGEAGYPADVEEVLSSAVHDELEALDRRLSPFVADGCLARRMVDAVVIYLAQTLDPADVVRLALRPDVRLRHLAALDDARAAMREKAKA